MIGNRLAGAALTVFVAFGVQVAQGVPAQAVASLRAAACCATNCDHARARHGTSECCRTRDGGDRATLGAQPSVRAPLAAGAFVVAPASSSAVVASFLQPTRAPLARGAPFFLLTHSFRV